MLCVSAIEGLQFFAWFGKEVFGKRGNEARDEPAHKALGYKTMEEASDRPQPPVLLTKSASRWLGRGREEFREPFEGVGLREFMPLGNIFGHLEPARGEPLGGGSQYLLAFFVPARPA
ncbi:hypothetical protein B6V76_17090 [Thioclava sp. IC9]|nr:hypothetical protein B6V76_17090 [Thioclava sp. IC9]